MSRLHATTRADIAAFAVLVIALLACAVLFCLGERLR